jgi:hypothetical protein
MDANDRGQRIALGSKVCRNCAKDHANCGMDELARAATFDVLPKATSRASVAYNAAAVHVKRA